MTKLTEAEFRKKAKEQHELLAEHRELVKGSREAAIDRLVVRARKHGLIE